MGALAVGLEARRAVRPRSRRPTRPARPPRRRRRSRSRPGPKSRRAGTRRRIRTRAGSAAWRSGSRPGRARPGSRGSSRSRRRPARRGPSWSSSCRSAALHGMAWSMLAGADDTVDLVERGARARQGVTRPRPRAAMLRCASTPRRSTPLRARTVSGASPSAHQARRSHWADGSYAGAEQRRSLTKIPRKAGARARGPHRAATTVTGMHPLGWPKVGANLVD